MYIALVLAYNHCLYIIIFIIDTEFQKRLQQQLSCKGQELEVTARLHLVMPNAGRKDPLFREVTIDNYQECLSFLRESALFEFSALDLTHPHEGSDRQLSKSNYYATVTTFFQLIPLCSYR